MKKTVLLIMILLAIASVSQGQTHGSQADSGSLVDSTQAD